MKHLLRLGTIIFVLLADCGSSTLTPQGPRTLSVMTHDSFAVTEDVIAAFEEDNHAQVKILMYGDAGTATNQAILNKDNQLADVFFGIDNTLLSRGLEAGIFEAYQSPLLAQIPDQFRLDPQNRALPVDFGDVCLNYDKSYFEDHNLRVPASLEDLAKPDYEGLLVVENPASSSPGLAFMLATIGHFGPDKYLDYWSDLRINKVKVVEDWETAYFSEFSGSSGQGSYPLVVSYASSPPAEIIFAENALEEAPTGSIVTPETCFRQVEFVGILIKEGTPNRDLAEAWVDFMLSIPFQEDMPLQMFVFPVNPSADLPEEFVQYAQLAEHPAFVPPDDIASMRDKWIEDWTVTVLR